MLFFKKVFADSFVARPKASSPRTGEGENMNSNNSNNNKNKEGGGAAAAAAMVGGGDAQLFRGILDGSLAEMLSKKKKDDDAAAADVEEGTPPVSVVIRKTSLSSDGGGGGDCSNNEEEVISRTRERRMQWLNEMGINDDNSLLASSNSSSSSGRSSDEEEVGVKKKRRGSFGGISSPKTKPTTSKLPHRTQEGGEGADTKKAVAATVAAVEFLLQQQCVWRNEEKGGGEENKFEIFLDVVEKNPETTTTTATATMSNEIVTSDSNNNNNKSVLREVLGDDDRGGGGGSGGINSNNDSNINNDERNQSVYDFSANDKENLSPLKVAIAQQQQQRRREGSIDDERAAAITSPPPSSSSSSTAPPTSRAWLSSISLARNLIKSPSTPKRKDERKEKRANQTSEEEKEEGNNKIDDDRDQQQLDTLDPEPLQDNTSSSSPSLVSKIEVFDESQVQDDSQMKSLLLMLPPEKGKPLSLRSVLSSLKSESSNEDNEASPVLPKGESSSSCIRCSPEDPPKEEDSPFSSPPVIKFSPPETAVVEEEEEEEYNLTNNNNNDGDALGGTTNLESSPLPSSSSPSSSCNSPIAPFFSSHLHESSFDEQPLESDKDNKANDLLGPIGLNDEDDENNESEKKTGEDAAAFPKLPLIPNSIAVASDESQEDDESNDGLLTLDLADLCNVVEQVEEVVAADEIGEEIDDNNNNEVAQPPPPLLPLPLPFVGPEHQLHFPSPSSSTSQGSDKHLKIADSPVFLKLLSLIGEREKSATSSIQGDEKEHLTKYFSDLQEQRHAVSKFRQEHKDAFSLVPLITRRRGRSSSSSSSILSHGAPSTNLRQQSNCGLMMNSYARNAAAPFAPFPSRQKHREICLQIIQSCLISDPPNIERASRMCTWLRSILDGECYSTLIQTFAEMAASSSSSSSSSSLRFPAPSSTERNPQRCSLISAATMVLGWKVNAGFLASQSDFCSMITTYLFCTLPTSSSSSSSAQSAKGFEDMWLRFSQIGWVASASIFDTVVSTLIRCEDGSQHALSAAEEMFEAIIAANIKPSLQSFLSLILFCLERQQEILGKQQTSSPSSPLHNTNTFFPLRLAERMLDRMCPKFYPLSVEVVELLVECTMFCSAHVIAAEEDKETASRVIGPPLVPKPSLLSPSSPFAQQPGFHLSNVLPPPSMDKGNSTVQGSNISTGGTASISSGGFAAGNGSGGVSVKKSASGQDERIQTFTTTTTANYPFRSPFPPSTRPVSTTTTTTSPPTPESPPSSTLEASAVVSQLFNYIIKLVQRVMIDYTAAGKIKDPTGRNFPPPPRCFESHQFGDPQTAAVNLLLFAVDFFTDDCSRICKLSAGMIESLVTATVDILAFTQKTVERCATAMTEADFTRVFFVPQREKSRRAIFCERNVGESNSWESQKAQLLTSLMNVKADSTPLDIKLLDLSLFLNSEVVSVKSKTRISGSSATTTTADTTTTINAKFQPVLKLVAPYFFSAVANCILWKRYLRGQILLQQIVCSKSCVNCNDYSNRETTAVLLPSIASLIFELLLGNKKMLGKAQDWILLLEELGCKVNDLAVARLMMGNVFPARMFPTKAQEVPFSSSVQFPSQKPKQQQQRFRSVGRSLVRKFPKERDSSPSSSGSSSDNEDDNDDNDDALLGRRRFAAAPDSPLFVDVQNAEKLFWTLIATRTKKHVVPPLSPSGFSRCCSVILEAYRILFVTALQKQQQQQIGERKSSSVNEPVVLASTAATVLKQTIAIGFSPSSGMFETVIGMLAECTPAAAKEAFQVFELMKTRSSVKPTPSIYSGAIYAAAHSHPIEGGIAAELLKSMVKQQHRRLRCPSYPLYVMVLEACVGSSDLEKAEEILKLLEREEAAYQAATPFKNGGLSSPESSPSSLSSVSPAAAVAPEKRFWRVETNWKIKCFAVLINGYLDCSPPRIEGAQETLLQMLESLASNRIRMKEDGSGAEMLFEETNYEASKLVLTSFSRLVEALFHFRNITIRHLVAMEKMLVFVALFASSALKAESDLERNLELGRIVVKSQYRILQGYVDVEEINKQHLKKLRDCFKAAESSSPSSTSSTAAGAVGGKGSWKSAIVGDEKKEKEIVTTDHLKMLGEGDSAASVSSDAKSLDERVLEATVFSGVVTTACVDGIVRGVNFLKSLANAKDFFSSHINAAFFNPILLAFTSTVPCDAVNAEKIFKCMMNAGVEPTKSSFEALIFCYTWSSSSGENDHLYAANAANNILVQLVQRRDLNNSNNSNNNNNSFISVDLFNSVLMIWHQVSNPLQSFEGAERVLSLMLGAGVIPNEYSFTALSAVYLRQEENQMAMWKTDWAKWVEEKTKSLEMHATTMRSFTEEESQLIEKGARLQEEIQNNEKEYTKKKNLHSSKQNKIEKIIQKNDTLLRELKLVQQRQYETQKRKEQYLVQYQQQQQQVDGSSNNNSNNRLAPSMPVSVAPLVHLIIDQMIQFNITPSFSLFVSAIDAYTRYLQALFTHCFPPTNNPSSSSSSSSSFRYQSAIQSNLMTLYASSDHLRGLEKLWNLFVQVHYGGNWEDIFIQKIVLNNNISDETDNSKKFQKFPSMEVHFEAVLKCFFLSPDIRLCERGYEIICSLPFSRRFQMKLWEDRMIHRIHELRQKQQANQQQQQNSFYSQF